MEKKQKKNWKTILPNVLTASRIVFTPIIIMLGYFGQMNWVIGLVVVAAITDFFDGKLARKWNTVSLLGAKLDAVADKIFAIGLIASLARSFPILLIPFGLELLIGIGNLYYHYQTNITKSLWIGKIKTAMLFTTVILGFVVCYTSKVTFLFHGALYATINLQGLSFIAYYLFYQEQKTEPANPLLVLEEPSEELEPTIMLDDLQDLVDEFEKDGIQKL